MAALAGDALAQGAPEPPTLRLPVARAWRPPVAAPGEWVRGTLTSADAAGIGLLPEMARPSRQRAPSPARDGRAARDPHRPKSHWLHGLLAGVAAGVAMGFAFDVDPERCHFERRLLLQPGRGRASGGWSWRDRRRCRGPGEDGQVAPGRPRRARPAAGEGRVRPAVRASADGLALACRSVSEGREVRHDRSRAAQSPLLVASVLSAACATTRYTQSRIAPPQAKGGEPRPPGSRSRA